MASTPLLPSPAVAAAPTAASPPSPAVATAPTAASPPSPAATAAPTAALPPSPAVSRSQGGTPSQLATWAPLEAASRVACCAATRSRRCHSSSRRCPSPSSLNNSARRRGLRLCGRTGLPVRASARLCISLSQNGSGSHTLSLFLSLSLSPPRRRGWTQLKQLVRVDPGRSVDQHRP